jgi:hypothetical protein
MLQKKETKQTEAVTHKRKNITYKRKIRSVLKEKMGKKSKAWTLHQKYKQLISEKDGFLRLWSGDLKAETGSEITATQAQTLQTKYATIRTPVNTENSNHFNNMTRQQTTYQRTYE